MNFLYINDENGSDNPASGDIAIMLADKDLLNLENDPEVDFVYIDVNDVTLQQTTYSNFSDYNIYIDSPFVGGQIQPETILFDDNNEALKATESSTIITSLTDTQISITFSLTRADGNILTGHYTGVYSNISNQQKLVVIMGYRMNSKVVTDKSRWYVEENTIINSCEFIGDAKSW